MYFDGSWRQLAIIQGEGLEYSEVPLAEWNGGNHPGRLRFQSFRPHHPEPLTDAFSADYLRERARGRSTAIKQFLMDNHVVVGVGNIYANEALYAAGIHPKRAAGNISAERLGTLVSEIKRVLTEAIRQGGTTLKDFTSADGKPGYFVQQLQVYGRGGQPCFHCHTLLTEVRMGQRTTVFCSHCQR